MPDAEVAAAVERAESDAEQLRRTAAEVFRKYMVQGRQARETGGTGDWRWEQAIGEILGVPEAAAFVGRVGEGLRARERPYRLENYDDAWRFDRLLDHFEDVLRDNT